MKSKNRKKCLHKLIFRKTTIFFVILLFYLAFPQQSAWAWYRSYYDFTLGTMELDGGTGSLSDLKWKANAGDTTIATGVNGGTDGAWNYRLIDTEPRLYLSSISDLVMDLGGNSYSLGYNGIVNGELHIDTAVNTTIRNGELTLKNLYLDNWATFTNEATINVVDGGQLYIPKINANSNLGTINLLGDVEMIFNYGWDGGLAGGTINMCDHTLMLTVGGRRRLGAVLAGSGTVIWNDPNYQLGSLNANNTWTGGLTMLKGELVIQRAGALNTSNPNVVTFEVDDNLRALALAGYSISVGGLVGGDINSQVKNKASNISSLDVATTLTIDTDSTFTFSGKIVDGGSAPLSIYKKGVGTQVLLGADTYTGTTVLEGGILRSETFMNGQYVFKSTSAILQIESSSLSVSQAEALFDTQFITETTQPLEAFNVGDYTCIMVAGTIFSGIPIVDAGSSRSTWLPSASIPLNGSIFNAVGTAVSTWSSVQGPASVVFDSTGKLDATATFSESGIYVLQLDVVANGTIATDEMVVTVYENSDNFGYDTDELQSYFTHDLGLEYDFTDLDFSRFSAPPSAYTHPRIFISPADLPDLRDRLSNTDLGAYVMTRITDRLTSELTGDSATYRAVYDDLASGDDTSFIASGVEDGIVARITYECFRCLIDDDTVGGAKVGAALATVAEKIASDIMEVMPTTDYRNDIQGLIHRQYVGLAYDFAYNYMTESQQSIVRGVLSLATANMWSVGMDALPAFHANTSNWVPTHIMHLLMNTLAIEGETGYDVDLFPRIIAAYERFLAIGVSSDGATYEGLGKNAIMAEMLIPMAKRGHMLVASLPAKNHIRKHYTYSMMPWGNGFNWDGEIGGLNKESRYADVAPFKYAFPDDVVIDFVYRNDLKGDAYSRLSDFNIRFPYKAMDFLVRAICADDWDRTRTWDQAVADLETMPLTYFANQRGLMITRSDWTADALQLWFQPRSVPGGHSHADRNNFVLGALGRVWADERGGHYNDGGGQDFAHSVILIDGVGAGFEPSYVIDQNDDGIMATCTGDAIEGYAGQPSTATAGGFPLNPLPETWRSMSLEILPDWYTSEKPSSLVLPTLIPFTKAFRTAALVRGKHPYALIVDDIQQDSQVRNYQWRMQLHRDFSDSATYTINGNDVVLDDPNSSSQLLVRILDCSVTPNISITNELIESQYLPVLTVAAETTSPDFKILLLPFETGMELPQTSWSVPEEQVIIDFESYRHELNFSVDVDGRTCLELVSQELPKGSVLLVL